MHRVKLAGYEPLFRGGEKLVFEHPLSPELLIKIGHQDFFNEVARRFPLSTWWRRLPRHWLIVNEITEHLAVRERSGGPVPFLQDVEGYVDTDRGVGLVVRAVRDEQGALAPSLGQLLVGGDFTGQHRQALDRLLQWLVNTDIIVRDLGVNNLVWDGARRGFVIIDGIGCKPSLSLRTLSRSYNRHSNRKRAAKLRARVERVLRR